VSGLPVLRQASDGALIFFCPGCQEAHTVRTPQWRWSGDLVRPTFTPSVLVKSGHHCSTFHAGRDKCWCDYAREHPDEPVSFVCYVCHSFVTDGLIQFLSDCTHSLAGQTVPLEPWRPRGECQEGDLS
jgi:hypothetical protein